MITHGEQRLLVQKLTQRFFTHLGTSFSTPRLQTKQNSTVMGQKAARRVPFALTAYGKLLLLMSSTESGAVLATEKETLLSEAGKRVTKVV